MSDLGELVLLDTSDGGYAIYWNGSATFNVWSVLGNDFAFRPLREVNVFTNAQALETPGALTLKDAQRIARDWWDNYGREDTATLEREGLV